MLGSRRTPYMVGSHTKIMKPTLNIHACSLVREEAVAYSLATGKKAPGTRESVEAAACSVAREGR